MAGEGRIEPRSVPAAGSGDAVTGPVPVEVLQAARRAFAARDPQAEVLELVFDSLLEEDRPTGPRRLVFGTAAQPAQLFVTVVDAPDDTALVTIEVSCSLRELQVDEVRSGDVLAEVSGEPGKWTTGPVPHGMLRVAGTLDDTAVQSAVLRV